MDQSNTYIHSTLNQRQFTCLKALSDVKTDGFRRKFENEDSDDSMPDTHTGKGKLSEWKLSLPGQKQTPPPKKKKKSAVVTGGGKKTKGKVASAKRDTGYLST